MTHDETYENQVIIETLEGTVGEGGPRPRTGVAGRAEAEMIERLYTEVVGLMPYDLDPVEPRPEVKARLMETIGGERAAAPASPTPVTAHPRFQEGHEPAGAARPTPPGWGWRRLVAAAVVVLAAVGAFGWFYLQLAAQRSTVAHLEQELAATNQQLAELTESRTAVLAALRQMGQVPDRLEFCPLRPRGERPLQPAAHGSLILAMEQGRWFLHARGLEPAEDKSYTLWFLDEDDNPVRRVDIAPGDRTRLSHEAEGIPRQMASVVLTLEPSGETTRPTGPQLLYGHRREMSRL